jgi:hypothetical protein
MLRRAGVLGALLCALVAASPARAGEEFPRPDFTIGKLGPNAQRAARALDAAQSAVARRWPSCRLRGPSPEVTVVDTPVPADLAAVFGVLRRPQTAAEAALVAETPDVPELGASAEDLVRSSLRIVRTLPDGLQVRLFVATEPRLAPRPEICPAINLTLAPPDLAGGGYITFGVARAVELRSLPPMLTIERGRNSLFVAAVPDAVARVDVVVARGRSPFTRRFYPTALRASGAVVDNLVAIPVSRPVIDAWVVHQTWRARDGQVVAELD